MKISAIDLTHRKFHRSFRGYRITEVDDLLRELAAELEEAARDRARLEDQIEIMRAETARFREMEDTLNNAILLAQRTADDLQTNARRDADLIIQEAHRKAAEVSESAFEERRELLNEIRRLSERKAVLVDSLRSAARDLNDWLESRRFEEILALPPVEDGRDPAHAESVTVHDQGEPTESEASEEEARRAVG